MSIQVVTVMGRVPDPVKEPYYRPELFFASVRKYGFEPIVLGTKPGDWGGLGSKAKLLKKALHDGTITADHIIFSDVFDVCFAADPHDVVQEFQNISLNTSSRPGILWNAEKACFSDASLAPLHPKVPTSFKYLNSGFSVGCSDAYRAFYEDSDPDLMLDDYIDDQGVPHYMNDQHHAMVAFLKGKVSMGLDWQCRICQSLFQCSPEEFDFTGDKIKNLETGTFPMVFHGNGDSKSNGMFEAVMNKLGYT